MKPEGSPSAASELVQRYDRPGPRYTSYPTAPEWTDAFGPAAYAERLDRADREAPEQPFSLYVHVPFCESLCFYCGCNVVITKNHGSAGSYLEHVEREIELVAAHLPRRRRASQLHLGGGTPTFLAPAELTRLVQSIRRRFEIPAGAELAVEADPRVTTPEHLAALAAVGFNRISMGVQDFSLAVQRAVHRIQSAEQTRALVVEARRLGFSSVNVDLMVGLPEQTLSGFLATLDVVLDIRPDRLALFSYAHVPWLKPAQGAFERLGRRLPAAGEKLEIQEGALERLSAAGYCQIGMDHFALADDELARAQREGRLFRNFQGYTVRPAPDAIAFGVTGISDVRGAYAQNAKEVSDYFARVDRGELPVVRGFALDEDDELRRSVIHGLLCNFTLDLRQLERERGIVFAERFAAELLELEGFERDGLVALGADRIAVTPLGRSFIRNVCMVFDRYLRGRTGGKPLFSRTV